MTDIGKVHTTGLLTLALAAVTLAGCGNSAAPGGAAGSSGPPTRFGAPISARHVVPGCTGAVGICRGPGRERRVVPGHLPLALAQ
jgi:hypothetical protein